MGLGIALAGAVGGVGEGMVAEWEQEVEQARQEALLRMRRRWQVEDREADQAFRSEQAEIEHGRALERQEAEYGLRAEETEREWDRADQHARRVGAAIGGGGLGGEEDRGDSGNLPLSGNEGPTKKAYNEASVAKGIVETAERLEMDPLDLATIISYETGGTFDPTQAGPQTKWGQHRGLIQFGEPQATEHGIDWNNPVETQLGEGGAVEGYFRKAGWKPGMSFEDAYSTVNAGAPGRSGASDEAAGGAPGTVRDKVNSPEMAKHRERAREFLKLAAGGEGLGGAGGRRREGADREEIAYLLAHPETDDEARKILARAFGEEAAAEYSNPVWAKDEDGNIRRYAINETTGRLEVIKGAENVTYWNEDDDPPVVSSNVFRLITEELTKNAGRMDEKVDTRAALEIKRKAEDLMRDEGMSETEAVQAALDLARWEKEQTTGTGWFDGPETTSTSLNNEGEGRFVGFEDEMGADEPGTIGGGGLGSGLGGPATAEAATPEEAPAAAPGGRITTREQYEALPPGARYMDPEGNMRVKGQ